MKRAVTKFISLRQSLLGNSGSDASEPGHRLDFNSVDDFYILLDNPHKSWTPGDELSGQIIFISKKNLANIIITLSLVGYVKINPSSHSKLRLVKRSLFNHTIRIYGSDDTVRTGQEYSNGLYKGEHRFPFIVKLPNKRIFTSIDFGKGRIVYLLRANVGDANSSNVASSPASLSSSSPSENGSSPASNFTRHKSFRSLQNSSFTSEKIINIVNPLDVSKLPPPQPKRLKIKDPRRTKMLARTQSSTSTINTFNTVGTVSSNNSDNQASLHTNTDLPSNNAPLAQAQNSTTSPGDTSDPESIRLSLEVSQRGFLRGELIPIKMHINHLKKVQDVNGIIITFVRVCRIENGPDGLFDSFRKDLQQQIVPLYVDPTTFLSEISTSIRVPADAFPTITGCPLVSFQYFLEVLINLSGKSISLDDNDHPKQTVQINETPSHTFMESEAKQSNFKFNFSLPSANTVSPKERSGFLNTDKYKRIKKFLQLTTEIVIGTHRLNDPTSVPEGSTDQLSASRRSSLIGSNVSGNGYSPSDRQSPSQSLLPNIPVNREDASPEIMETPPYTDGQPSFSAPNYLDIVGPSHTNDLLPLPNTNGHSEKERMRIHEESLLPSEPILDDIDEDDKETISPLNHDALFESEPDHNGGHSPYDVTISNDDNNFSTTADTLEGHTRPYHDDDDSLYHLPSNTMESAPRYDNATKDTLLQQGDHEEQH